MNGFQTYYDSNGDLRVVNGWVIQPKTGVMLSTIANGASLLFPVGFTPGFQPVTTPVTSVFVGGSGRNLVSTGLVAPLSGAMPPVGFFTPTVTDEYACQLGGFTLAVTGPSAATISDGIDVVAILTTGGTAPLGTYDSTTYGETTYNGGAPFVLTVTGEGIGTGAIPDCTVEISAGSAVIGDYLATDPALYLADADPSWTIVIDPSGSAELSDATDVVAVRAAGQPFDPSGEYESTTYGQDTYNPVVPDAPDPDDPSPPPPVTSEPWRALVQRSGRTPLAGFTFLEIVEAAGVLTAVNGPFFATTLPTATTDHFYYPLGHSDGAGGVETIHVGAVIWP